MVQNILEQQLQGVQQLWVGHGRGQPADAETEEGMADLQCQIVRGQKCQNLDRDVHASVVE